MRIYSGEKNNRKKRLIYASMLTSEVFGKQSAVLDNSVMNNIFKGAIAKQISLAITIATNLASAAIPEGQGSDD